MAVSAALVVLAVAVAVRRGSRARGELSIDGAAIATEVVARRDFVLSITTTGILVPERVEWRSAPSAARVVSIAARPGARVSASDTIVVLENPDLELLSLEAEQKAANAESLLAQLVARTDVEARTHAAGLVGLRSELVDADRHAASSDRLAQQGLLGAIELGDARSKHAGIARRVEVEEDTRRALDRHRESQIAAERTEVARLREIAAFRRKQLAALRVTAAIDGVVQDLPLESGQWLAMGALVAKVAVPDALRAEVKVAEASAKDVRRGATVRFVSPPGMIGVVERVDPIVVAGTVKVLVALSHVPPSARADQAVSGAIEVDTVAGALVVGRPASAREDAPCAVFRVSPDGARATKIIARIGRASPREVQIESGLGEGDRIVVSDTAAYDDATTLRIR